MTTKEKAPSGNGGEDKAEPKARSGGSEALMLLKDLAVIILIYLLFTTFGWGSYHIPSSSMEPTLEVGDRIFVSKLVYGYNKYSFPFQVVPIEKRIFDGEPKRGDVVVFTLPYRNNTDFIKRVIGLPGDTVQMKGGRLYINGTMVPRTLIREVNYTDYQGTQRRVKEYEETLPGGVKHRIYEQTDKGDMDTTMLYLVPEGTYFMMGDNRDNSMDSRYLTHMGFVKHQYLVGRADITSISFYNCAEGKDIWCPLHIPLGRFFKRIH